MLQQAHNENAIDMEVSMPRFHVDHTDGTDSHAHTDATGIIAHHIHSHAHRHSQPFINICRHVSVSILFVYMHKCMIIFVFADHVHDAADRFAHDTVTDGITHSSLVTCACH